jgi:hypothetical protein
VEVKVGKLLAPALLDTGAQISLMDKSLFDRLGCRIDTTDLGATPTSVDGSRLHCYGLTAADVSVGNGIRARHGFTVVEGIRPNLILGMDFIGKVSQSLTIDLKAQVVRFDREPVVFSSELPQSSCRLVPSVVVARVASNTELPARSERLVWLKVDSRSEQGVFEPSQEFVASTAVLPARVLAISTDGRIPVKMCNLAEEPVLLYANKAVGTFEGATVEDSGHDATAREDPPGWNINPDLPKDDAARLRQLLEQNDDLFARHEYDLGTTGLLQHRIELEPGARPCKQVQRRMPLSVRDQVDSKIGQMLQAGIIEPSTSPWASNLLVVRKKSGDIRLCTDWRQLNACTVKDAYPLPHLQQAMDALVGCSWFSTIDCRQGYHQVEVAEEDRHKTAFYSTRGLMQFRKMGFGMCNAPATFQRLMELVMSGLSWEVVLTYIDDIIVFSKSFEEHLARLSLVFERLRKAGLKLHRAKSVFGHREVLYLGHLVSQEGIAPDPGKVDAIRNMRSPASADEVKRFLGMLGFYRRFIHGFSETARVLHEASQRSRDFEWTSECERAFGELKARLTAAPVLRLPDFSKQFVLSCDSSNVAVGAVLSQLHDGAELPVAFASRTLNKAERNYSATDRELLALVWSLKHFRTYLLSVPSFTVYSDHRPLQGLLATKDPEGRLARWLTTLQQFSFSLFYRPGRDNVVPDALSRVAGTCLQPRWDGAQLHSEQLQDPLLSRTFQALASGIDGLSDTWAAQVRELMGEASVSAAGVLQFRGKPVIPAHLRMHFLQQAHSCDQSGHLGVDRTVTRLMERCWWPQLRRDAEHWVASCAECLAKKNPARPQRAPLQATCQPTAPWQLVQIDIKGPLPRSTDGNAYILSMCDAFSKWMETAALAAIDAVTVAEALLKAVVLRHGAPQVLHSDQGRQFESDVFTRLCERLGVEKTRTSPFHPSGNGIVERGNRTLGDMLATVVSENQLDWDRKLPFVTWAYNTSVHSTTGLSPFQVLHGWPPRLPMDSWLIGGDDPAADGDPNGFLQRTQRNLQTAFDSVHGRLRQAQIERNRQANEGARFEPYEPGQLVMLRNSTVKRGQTRCLSVKWKGPFKVLRRLGEVNYRIRDQAGRRRKLVVHHDRLRPHVQRRSSLQPPESDAADHADAPPGDLDGGLLPAWPPLDSDGELDEQQPEAPAEPAAALRRSTRERRVPNFFMAGFS